MDGTELQELLAQLDEQDSVVRGRAAEQLGAVGGSAASHALGRLLDDPDVIVRFKAARALAWLGDDRGSAVLVWALDRKELCFAALEAMTHLGSPGVLPDVRCFFRRWFLHPLERMQAAAALHSCGDEEGTEFLRSRLVSALPEERGFALELWGRLKMPGALDLLRGVLSDPTDSHRMDAARGLGHLGDARSLPLLDRVAMEQEDALLAEVARETAAEMRQKAQ